MPDRPSSTEDPKFIETPMQTTFFASAEIRLSDVDHRGIGYPQRLQFGNRDRGVFALEVPRRTDRQELRFIDA
jgi:hypothetical protein